MPVGGQFKAGSFAFPTSTGGFSVTGLEFEPQGIIFFGGNQSTEDTLLTPTAPGVFFGMAWRDVDSGLVDFQSQANTTFGVSWASQPITCLSTGVTIEYQASAVTFDADGFTLTVSTAAPAARLVHYLAWGDFDGAEGKSFGGTSIGDVFDVTSLGYRPLSSLMFSMFSTSASRDSNANGAVYFTMGTGNFPRDNTSFVNSNNATALTMHAGLSLSDGLTVQYLQQSIDAITASVHGGILGFWQDDIDHLQPNPNFDSDALRLTLFGSPNRAQLVWWNCEGSVHQANTPEVAATSTITARPYISEIQAALFFGTTGYSSLAQDHGSVHTAYVYGVLTEDYQGVVAFDTGAGGTPADGTPAFFQSQNACFADSLAPSTGIRVASGVIDGNDVILTGEIASNSTIGPSFVQLWGAAPRFRPHIYRRVFR